MKSPRILVIRKDNIGDLVCTTPLFARLRARFPEAFIAALVTEYNTPVLTGNPHLDAVYSYQKAKHRHENESWLGVYARRAALFFRLRRMKFDWILLPGGPHPSALRAARVLNPGQTIVRTQTPPGAHEVFCVLACAAALEIDDATPPPPTRVIPDRRLMATLPPLPHDGRRPIGVHISARKPPQRWPVERFITLIGALHERGERVLLFWSPGAADNPLHPGDDDKARQILQAVGELAVTPMPTRALPELIAGLARCQAVICSDGGAMHLAAGLGKPIVCLFGNSDARRWHPWGPRYQLLQPASHQVGEISTAELLNAFDLLMARHDHEIH
ncbi:MAG: glycosyltransferase family 9 protein [Magnetococcales bacterium]|nr:glycosyltransferase family 9 protein [Magnetococcales bacterium]